MYGRTYVRTDGRKEIHPCVLQDIGPLGPLPKKLMSSLYSSAIKRQRQTTQSQTTILQF